jgi:hypothetical protein
MGHYVVDFTSTFGGQFAMRDEAGSRIAECLNGEGEHNRVKGHLTLFARPQLYDSSTSGWQRHSDGARFSRARGCGLDDDLAHVLRLVGALCQVPLDVLPVTELP